jgi:FlgN protein.
LEKYMSASLSPDVCAKQLAELLDKQTEVCQNIKMLSEKQQALVAGHKEDDLLTLLSDKQQLIDQQQTLFSKAQDLSKTWEGLKSHASQAMQKRVEDSWETLKKVLNDVVTLEDASRGMLQDQKDRVSKDIGKIQLGKVANKAYGGGVRVPPRARYSDKQG